MKKIFAIILLTLLLSHSTKSQIKRMLSMQLSVNQVEMSFQHSILNEKLWTEFSAGVGNQDINNKFDDFTTRIGIGFIAFSKPKSQILINTGIGIYFSNNDYYSVTVPLINAGARYTRFFSKTKKHGFLVSMGYRYGKMNYKQEYSSDIVTVSTIGIFKVSPLYVSIGYGFRF